MSSSSELARVSLLKRIFEGPTAAPGTPGSSIRVGIGDDAAVLEAGGSLVWTVDTQVDGTHFRPQWVSWEDVGWRSFMAAASDLAAMGAEPLAALSSLVLAPAIGDEELEALARGQAAAAAEIGAPIIGGNLARGTQTSITTTLLGRAASPVLRSGAEAGDSLWLAGPVGLAAAGLAMLVATAGPENMQTARVRDTCLAAWRRPAARIRDGLRLAGVAHAAIDVSDGLSRDAWQLAEASDRRFVFDESAILAAGGEALAAAASLVGRDALDLALNGGEDYALLATSSAVLPGFSRIGHVEDDASAGNVARLWLRRGGGVVEAIEAKGFDHFMPQPEK